MGEIAWTGWHFRKITLRYIMENGFGVMQMGLTGSSVRKLLQYIEQEIVMA